MTAIGPSAAGGPPLEALLGAAAQGVPHTIQAQPASPQFKQALAQTIADLHRLATLADDPQDHQDVLKCLTALQAIQAAEQKERDQMMGGRVSPRALRRTRANGGY